MDGQLKEAQLAIEQPSHNLLDVPDEVSYFSYQ